MDKRSGLFHQYIERVHGTPPPQPPSASGEREANIAELAALVLTPDRFGGFFHNHIKNRMECCDCGAPDDGDGNVAHAETCPSITDEARHRRRLALAYAIQAAPPAAQPSAEQQPVAWLQQNIDRPTWFEIAGANDKAVTKDWTDAFPVFRQSADAQPSADDPQFPFYELRFIMRVLSHQGSAPKEDWQTAYGMARDIFVRWSKERQAAEPHPPSRACMCNACKPSFENGADDPAQRYDIVRQVAGPSAEWLAEAERLIDFYAESFSKPTDSGKCRQRLAALLDHMKARL